MGNLVSILIPAYNAEKWIRDTILSASNQSWTNKEIIIVDNGSSDNTLQVALSFQSKSVKISSQQIRGASAARNKAYSLAQGDYIQWLDADDLLAPDKIACQVAEAKDLNTSDVLLSSSFGLFNYRHEKAVFKPTSLWQDLSPVEFLTAKFSENIWMNPAVWLVSRRLSEKAGPWDERLSLDDDGEYFARLVAASERIQFVPAAKMYYRQCDIGSLSKRTSDKACHSLFLSLSLSISYLRALDDSDNTKKACLKYLQTWYQYFYPDKHELLAGMNRLAHELGGHLVPPELSWKYYPIKTIFGWKTARNVRNTLRKTKLLARIKLDELASKLSS